MKKDKKTFFGSLSFFFYWPLDLIPICSEEIGKNCSYGWKVTQDAPQSVKTEQRRRTFRKDPGRLRGTGVFYWFFLNAGLGGCGFQVEVA